MNFHLTDSFKKTAKKLCKRDNQLELKLSQQFEKFYRDHRSSSLKLHKLSGKRSNQYAIWIRGNLRALSIKKGDTYIFFDLVNHDQY